MQSSDDSARIAEDDEHRSNYVRRLVQGVEWGPFVKTSIKISIPKVVLQYWHNLAEIPEDVQSCLDTWESLKNQGYERELFSDDTARAFISGTLGQRYVLAFNHCYHPAMRCDYFRLCYIFTNGGFYVDADERYQGTDCDCFFFDNKLKLQPLCYDTSTGEMINTDTFVRDRKRSQNWIFYFNNNPIIAPPNHPIIDLALERATRILLSGVEQPEIQSTTGPGNITASLVRYSSASTNSDKTRDFVILPDWEATSISPWPLSYRNDQRNWRLWKS